MPPNKTSASDWAPAFAAVPRSAFLPDVMWPFDMDTGRSVTVGKADDPEAWRAYADADVPIVTQWDDGEGDGLDPGRLATSSASMPSVVFSMLRDLDVRPGHRVLEIGTGTGYNAALLAHRLGVADVVSMEVDGGVAATARAALRRFGMPVEVVTGDGFLGHVAGAPYDRIIATCGLRAIPYAWVEQARPGGVIVVPWGTDYVRQDAVVRLVVDDDGARASGRFTGPVEFMKLRAQRRAWPRHGDYVPAEGVAGAGVSSTTTLAEGDFVRDRFDVLRFALGLRVPACLCAVADKRDGVRPVWLYGLSDRSWACVLFREGRSTATVHQGGPRRLWDETEAAHAWWKERGEPGFERFGLTVGADGTRAWVDEPSASWPVRGG
ncbi:methyltransferase domain-containing protein [Streptomyces adelaidensis]|uniref:methyltransferase domain-containing protein n=1 Tax=Streptomyces adelaidensis TaxID=2796465 RepID=UPI0027DC446B|nr:methyltransferase domain-containing protein [Streptomyces adelaidensis]